MQTLQNLQLARCQDRAGQTASAAGRNALRRATQPEREMVVLVAMMPSSDSSSARCGDGLDVCSFRSGAIFTTAVAEARHWQLCLDCCQQRTKQRRCLQVA